MSLRNWPVIRQFREFGGDDSIVDALIVVGLALVAAGATLGRHPAILGAAALYVVAVATYPVYRWVRRP
ncbi:hypothetical protein [Halarchaeum nitratireducens]|uniref:Uncharacterized protein n=1 Tax=Halarchaeum nitratireducens TaxID=489913 RepID=A0A830GEG4_9EURY|nr:MULTISPECIES: hypothetical protein [Halarchaeum]MBP2252651.1 putative glycosyltransferase [Halarchaeum solikamskense]GGN23551.1 hypothetical protein GCM10009021_26400 [Halarchaeum nitratireducens]